MFNVRITTKAVEGIVLQGAFTVARPPNAAVVVLTREWGPKPPGGLAKLGCCPPPPRLGFSRSGWGLRTCISSKFQRMLHPWSHSTPGDPPCRERSSLSPCGEGCKRLAPGLRRSPWGSGTEEVTQVFSVLIFDLSLVCTF